MTSALLRNIAFLAAVATIACAGMTAAQTQGNLQITSTPPGALVTLQGDMSLSGVTPVAFDRLLAGRYRVEVTRDGYERYRSTAYLSESLATTLNVTLAPKTRVKALFRSLVIPGWGQRYYGNATKSTLLLLGTVAAAAGYVVIKDDYDSKVDDYNARLAERAAATKWEDLAGLNRAVRDAQGQANDAEDNLNIITGVAVGIYLFNLLDAVLLFPEFYTYSEYKSISVQPQAAANRIGLDLTFKF
jgi:hypothetical protein